MDELCGECRHYGLIMYFNGHMQEKIIGCQKDNTRLITRYSGACGDFKPKKPDWPEGHVVKESEEYKALDRQEGGTHYCNFEIQPVEFVTKNKLGFCEGNVIKYVCRHRFKNGLEDLLKARHYIDLLIELEYEKEKENVE